MTDSASRNALRISILIAALMIGIDTLVTFIMFGPRLIDSSALITLAFIDLLLAALTVALLYWLLRRQFEARSAAEVERGAAEARMYDLVDVAPVAIIGADDRLRITSWNPAAEKLYGWTRAEALGRPVSDVLRSETTPEQIASAQRAVQERGEYVSEWTHRTKTGEPIIVLGDTITLRTPQGKVTGYVSVNRDVTAGRRMEEELRESRARLQLIMDNVPSAISYVDRDECYVFANRGYERLMGLNPADMVGKTIRELQLPGTYEKGKPNIDAALAGQPRIFENQLRAATGGTFPALVQFTPHVSQTADGRDEVVGVFITVTDVSRVREAEEVAHRERTLAEQRRQEWQLLFDNMTVGAAVFDAAGQPLAENQRYRLMHGLADDETVPVLADTPQGFEVRRRDGTVVPVEQWPTFRALNGEEASAEYVVTNRRTGKTINARYTATPHRDAKGAVDQVFLTVEDVTDLRHAAETLAEREAVIRRQLAEIESIYNTAPIGLAVFDTELCYLRINERLAEMNGIPAADHIGKTPREIVPDIARIAEGILNRILETGEPVLDAEFRGATPATGDEEHIWIEQWVPFMDSAGKTLGIHVVVQDVTAERRALAALEESRELMRRALQVGRGFAFQFRPRSDEVERSPEAARILGLPEAEAVRASGPAYFQLVHPDDRPRYVARMMGLTPDKDTYRTTYRIIQPNGNTLHVAEAARGLFDEEGTLIQVFGITQDVTERVQAEQARDAALAQAEAQRERAEALAGQLQIERDTLSTIMEHTHTQLAYLDPQFRFVRVNSAYAAGSGYRPEELLGRGHFDLFPSEENQAIFASVLATGRPIEYSARPFEFPGRPERGTTYWDWTLVPVKDAAGGTLGLVLSLSDVTEQKRAEEVLRNARDELELAVAAATAELRAAVAMLQAEIVERKRAEEALAASEARLRILVEQVPAILWTTDRNIVYTSLEGAGLTSINLKPGQLVGRPVAATRTPDNADAAGLVLDAHTRALAGESVTYRTAWGEAHFEGYIEPLRDAEGEIIGAIGVAMDITEREEQYRSIFESTSDAMIIISLDGRIVDANAAARKLSGYSYEEFVTLSPTAFVREDQRESIERVFEAVRAGRRLERQAVGVRKDGSQFDLELRASQFQYAGESHVLAVVRDITERVRAYQLLEQRVRERTRELSALLAFTRQASATLEVRPLMQLVVDEVGRLVDNSGVSLLMLEGDTLVMAAHRGPLPATTAEQVRLRVNDPGVRSLLLNETLPIVLPDINAESQAAEAIRRVGGSLIDMGEPLRSVMWVPLTVKGKLIGGLGIGHREPGQYGDREAGLAQAMASQAAVAIENARLYEDAQELAIMRERQRLARELHDSVTQSLYSLALMTEAARRLVSAGNLDRGMGYLVRIGESAQQVLKEMRLLVYELRPLMLEKDGLASALKQRLDTVEGRAGVETKLIVEGSGLLPEYIETDLYRIAQEALNNSLKHSAATAVAVYLDTTSDVITLKVQDNGRGFSQEEIADKGGLGLVSIRERIQRLGGTADIVSAPGQGVTITAIIPLSGNTQK